MAELKQCPFCGRMPTVEDCGDHRYFVKCKCGIEQSRLYRQKCDAIKRWNTRKDEPQNHSGEVTEMVKDEPQTFTADGIVFMKMDDPQERNDISKIEKMIKIVDGILGDDDLCEGCKDGREGLSCAECRRKYADKIIKILRKTKTEPQTDCQ